MNATLFRVRVAILWVATAVAVASSLLFALVAPGVVTDMAAGEFEGEPLTDLVGYMFSTLVFVPLVMTAVTLLSDTRATRWANLVVALALGGFAVMGVTWHLVLGDFDPHVIMAALAGALVLSVAWLNAAALRKPASTPPVLRQEPRQEARRIEVGAGAHR